MTELDSLRPLVDENNLKEEADHGQIKIFYDKYLEDFVTTPLVIDGKKIRIDTKPPKVAEYGAYQETFFHIVTRKLEFTKQRHYECKRANRIHWIKPILLSHPTKDILYYKWKDFDGVCKEHFWLISKKFMVILKTIAPDKQIVTSFCVDDDQKLKYFERYSDFKDGKKTC